MSSAPSLPHLYSGKVRELLGEDPDVGAVLDEARLDTCFDLKRALADVGRTFDELDRMEATPPARRDE